MAFKSSRQRKAVMAKLNSGNGGSRGRSKRRGGISLVSVNVSAGKNRYFFNEEDGDHFRMIKADSDVEAKAKAIFYAKQNNIKNYVLTGVK